MGKGLPTPRPPTPAETRSPAGNVPATEGAAAAGLLCSALVQAGLVGGVDYGPREGAGMVGAELSSPRRKLLLSEEAGGTSWSAPRLRTPERCPLLPPSPVFLVCPLVSSLASWWFFRPWQCPCCCSLLFCPVPPCLLGVDTSLGSFGGCLPGSPHPYFSVLPFPAWKPRAGWTSSSTHSPSLLCGAGGGAMAGLWEHSQGLRCVVCMLGDRGLGSEDLASQSPVANVEAFLEPTQHQK